jgi:hypothetical protein
MTWIAVLTFLLWMSPTWAGERYAMAQDAYEQMRTKLKELRK